MADLDLSDLLDSWLLALRAERKSDRTVTTYSDGVRAFLRWAAATGTEPTMTRDCVNQFVDDLLAAGAEGATARSRQLAVRRFSAWLAEEGEIDRDELAHLRPPKLDTKVVPELDVEQVRALLKACQGKAFVDRRDDAMVRFMLETLARIGEVIDMTVDDVDLKEGMATVRRGKGGKGRRVPFGPQTGRALDRYMRARRGHRLADTGRLWLGDRGATLGYPGARKALLGRARAAGIEDFHPHVLRHTGSGRWLGAGGSETGLMAVAGWSNRSMIERYTKATSERRAAEEARRLNLGDL
ncbi:tyrosine-type recombinase/integrase [Actinomadura algeriensis]|uniref:Site-specific recombinase XerD n=1 Tax=Actinomadura algeriensis TaxID=1679523 RepID=A0ABR9JLZ7_9ACTN|nr:tyrosine-type recombinase/integrase [Actinomadura algeriensis]MBE1531150.1 site-specific recombinase XerD [Actinomadura algeriensis]